MSIEQVSDASFKQSVIDNSNHQPVLVDFWAEWCGPCKALGPILENVSVEFEGKVAIKKVNIDENPEAPANFGIRSIPTMILFKNGSIADTKIGLSTEADLKNWLNSHL
jgi:thioredoxin 1